MMPWADFLWADVLIPVTVVVHVFRSWQSPLFGSVTACTHTSTCKFTVCSFLLYACVCHVCLTQVAQ